MLALEHAGPAIYDIVDDEPAPVREWPPVLADALGAKAPRHFPVWLARMFAGEAGVMLGTESRGASNALPFSSDPRRTRRSAQRWTPPGSLSRADHQGRSFGAAA